MSKFSEMFMKLGAKVDSTSARKLVIAEHRNRSLELDRIRCRACQLATILVDLNERYSAAKRERCPCYLVTSMDRAVRRAIITYRQLGLAISENLLRAASMTVTLPGAAADGRYPVKLETLVVADEDGINTSDDGFTGGDDGVSEQLGLFTQMRDRCCRQAEIVGDVMHRATLYQVMSTRELKQEYVAVDRLYTKFKRQPVDFSKGSRINPSVAWIDTAAETKRLDRIQYSASHLTYLSNHAERDDAKLRQLTDSYRQLKYVLGTVRYFKLRAMIKEAVGDYRNG